MRVHACVWQLCCPRCACTSVRLGHCTPSATGLPLTEPALLLPCCLFTPHTLCSWAATHGACPAASNRCLRHCRCAPMGLWRAPLSSSLGNRRLPWLGQQCRALGASPSDPCCLLVTLTTGMCPHLLTTAGLLPRPPPHPSDLACSPGLLPRSPPLPSDLSLALCMRAPARMHARLIHMPLQAPSLAAPPHAAPLRGALLFKKTAFANAIIETPCGPSRAHADACTGALGLGFVPILAARA